MSEALYIEPNRKARYFMWFTVILFVGLRLLLEPIDDYFTPAQDSSLEDKEASLILSYKFLIGVFFIELILGIIWAIYCGYLGYRTLMLRRFPPSGLIVVFRTQIRTGKQAIKAGCFSILYALFICLYLLLISNIHSSLYTILLGLEKNKSETISPNVVNNSAEIKWEFFRKDSNDSLHDSFTPYIAPETILVSGSKVKMWSLSDYDTVQQSYDPSFSYLSFKTLVEYDCKEEESRYLYFSFHTKNMGKGKVANSSNISGHWWPVRPNRHRRAEWNYVCGKGSKE